MRAYKEKFVFYIIRIITAIFRFIPLRCIHLIGNFLGFFLFYSLKKFRKRAFSNLALAKDLAFNNKQIRKNALKAFQNLTINCLEYPKFYYLKNFERYIFCENPEKAYQLYQQKQGIIFFCAHQSNWEVLFLDGNLKMKGIAIGKPIKNKLLYNWILKIREKTGGKIIEPKNALKYGLKSLKKGLFLGIVGDQGMPESNYIYPFLGRNAKTSTAPALLAYKTSSPIIVALTKRKKGKYFINYSDPIWPDLSKPIDIEIKRMMDKSLYLIENSIKKSPSEWLWQHNRWKMQTPNNVYRKFRHDSIAIIIDKDFNENIYPLTVFREIYPHDLIFLISPFNMNLKNKNIFSEICYFEKPQDMFLKDYRFKFIFNFTNNQKLKKHYLKFSAFNVLNIQDIYKYAKPHISSNMLFEDILKRALCRPNTLWSNNAF
jgi:Kdo2-lipid IVA lauroyltransferase/acyltransferase